MGNIIVELWEDSDLSRLPSTKPNDVNPFLHPTGFLAVGDVTLEFDGSVTLNGISLYEDTSGTPAGIDLFGAGKGQFSITDGGGSYANVVYRCGYNIDAGGSRIDATKPGIANVFESKYRSSGSSPFMFEYHVEGFHSDGTTFRVLTGTVPHSASDANNGTSRIELRNQTYVFAKFNGDRLLQIEANTINDAASFAYPGHAILFFETNNYVFAKQLNGAGTDYVELPFVNSSDIYVLPTVSRCINAFSVVGVLSGETEVKYATGSECVRLVTAASGYGGISFDIFDSTVPLNRMALWGDTYATVLNAYANTYIRIANSTVIGVSGSGIEVNGTSQFNGDCRFGLINSTTPDANGQLRIEATSNTTLTLKYKGSDGVVRSGTITLS